MNVETETVPMSVLEKAIAKIHEQQNVVIARQILKANAMHEVYSKMKELGVKGLPDQLNEWHLVNGMTVEVTEPSEWGKIHKAVGKLTMYDKRPVNRDVKRGRQSQMIELVMAPEGYSHPLYYQLHFVTKRKLTDKDKCQVKTVVKKEVQVVCSVR